MFTYLNLELQILPGDLGVSDSSESNSWMKWGEGMVFVGSIVGSIMSDISESIDGAISAMLIIYFTFYLFSYAYFVRLGFAKYYLI